MVRLAEVLMALFAFFMLVGRGLTYPEAPANPHDAMNEDHTCLECHDTYLDEVDEHEFIVNITDVCENCHDLDKERISTLIKCFYWLSVSLE